MKVKKLFFYTPLKQMAAAAAVHADAPYLDALNSVIRSFGSVRTPNIDSLYHRIRRLGAGAFGTTYKVRALLPDGRTVDNTAPVCVMKHIEKARVSKNEASVQHLAAELAVTGHIAPGCEYLNKRLGLYHDEHSIYMLLELCSGPRPDVASRVAHIIAKRRPASLPDFDAIMDGFKARATAAGVNPNDEEAFGDFMDRDDVVAPIAGIKRSLMEKLALDMGLRSIDEGNFAEMPVGDTLFNVIVAPRVLSDEHNRIMTKQMLQGFKYLHECKVVNRDVKPENIMVSVLRRVQLKRDPGTGKVTGVVVFEKYLTHVIDYGLCKMMRARDNFTSPGACLQRSPHPAGPGAAAAAAAPAAIDDDDRDPYADEDAIENAAAPPDLAARAPGEFGFASTNCGSHAYLSLETTNGILAAIGSRQSKWHTTIDSLPKLDVWAVGACSYCLANGTPPFRYSEQYRRLSSEEKLKQIRDAIMRGLQFRPSASPDSRRFTQKLMDTNLQRRPSAAQALEDPYVDHECTVVRTEINANGQNNRCQMMKDLPVEIAQAVLRDMSAAKRNDFPAFFLLSTVKAAFASSPGSASGRGGNNNAAAPAAAAAAAATDANEADEEPAQGRVVALREMGNALNGARLQEEGVDE
jgi:serine/threonine protein kinase